MNVNPRNNNQIHDEEIDMLESIALLWRGKWLVLVVIVLLGVPTFVYLTMTPPIYRAETVLDRTSNYRLQRIQPSKLEGGDVYQIHPIGLDLVYSTALAHLDSLFVKKLFWESLAGKRSNLSELSANENEKQFRAFTDDLMASIPDTGKEGLSMLCVLTLENENFGKATDLLGKYLEFVDRYTIVELSGQLRAGYAASRSKLESDYQSLLVREKQKIADELVRLSEAYEIAKALNIIETPYEQVENVELVILDDKQYLLGARVLAEEINSLKARLDKPLAAFVPMLRDMEHWKGQLERDLERLDDATDSVHAFVVVSPPESSIDPVKPNKLLIFIAVLFAAGILGVVIVFTREGIKSYKARGVEQEI